MTLSNTINHALFNGITLVLVGLKMVSEKIMKFTIFCKNPLKWKFNQSFSDDGKIAMDRVFNALFNGIILSVI